MSILSQAFVIALGVFFGLMALAMLVLALYLLVTLVIKDKRMKGRGTGSVFDTAENEEHSSTPIVDSDNLPHVSELVNFRPMLFLCKDCHSVGILFFRRKDFRIMVALSERDKWAHGECSCSSLHGLSYLDTEFKAVSDLTHPGAMKKFNSIMELNVAQFKRAQGRNP